MINITNNAMLYKLKMIEKGGLYSRHECITSTSFHWYNEEWTATGDSAPS